MDIMPRFCPMCGKPCCGRRSCKDCMKKGRYGTLSRYYGYKQRRRNRNMELKEKKHDWNNQVAKPPKAKRLKEMPKCCWVEC